MIELKKIYNKIFIFVSCIFVILIVLFIGNNKIKENEVIFKYKLDGKTNYIVNLKENGGISKQKLFVSNTVDNILVNFDYNYRIDKKQNIKYRYEIVSSVISDLDDSNESLTEVFRKNKKIVSTEYKNINSDVININDSVLLDYDYYNLIASEYNNSVNIAIKSKLSLKLNLYVIFDGLEEKKYTSYLSFPLEKNTFSISTNDMNDSGDVEGNVKNTNKIIFEIICLVSIIIFIGLIIYEIIKIRDYKNTHALEFKYRKIMQDYDNIVVPITGFPNDKSIINIRVLFFKSMIDIQKELHVPILCYKSDLYIAYIIISNKVAYIYFLNNKKEKI